MAAAISVGIDETDELMTDEDTLAGKRQSLDNQSMVIRINETYADGGSRHKNHDILLLP